MRLTKFEHATMTVEEDGATLVIDPGNFARPLNDLHQVVAIVLTHEHADHADPEQITRILRENPDARLIGPAPVATALAKAGIEHPVEPVGPGQSVEVGPFSLRFFGGLHAEIHSSLPEIDNVGVVVNDTLWFPGDSYAVPDGDEIDVLAAPAGGPWLKIGEAMDYVLTMRPKRAFGVHEAPVSELARPMYFGRLKACTEHGGGAWLDLKAGDSVEL